MYNDEKKKNDPAFKMSVTYKNAAPQTHAATGKTGKDGSILCENAGTCDKQKSPARIKKTPTARRRFKTGVVSFFMQKRISQKCAIGNSRKCQFLMKDNGRKYKESRL